MNDLSRAYLQKKLGHLFFLPFSGSLILFMKWGLRYEIVDLAKLRRRYRELTDDKRPLLICPNHLTFMDSIFIIYAFGNHWWYFVNFRRMSWNLPAIEYSETAFFRLVGILAKCIFIDRGGTREHHARILDLSRALLARGEPFTIFPEGRRSRIGRFDDRKLAYGIGKIISALPECRVLCSYIHIEGQKAYGKFPPRGARVRIDTSLLEFKPNSASPDEVGTITRRIADEVLALEKKALERAAATE